MTAKEVAEENEILRCTVGSELFGLSSKENDSDIDQMGIFIEPKQYVFGTYHPMDHYAYRTQPDGVRSGAGDLDLICYSLRKYVGLAIKGNPTALLPMFAPKEFLVNSTPIGEELRAIRKSFLSLEAIQRFLGYMHAQHERMMGSGKQSRLPNRPELVEKYGFDVKYAAHALRLAYQGWEVLTTGNLSLPMDEQDLVILREIKKGQHSLLDVSDMILNMEINIKQYLQWNNSPLPAKADYALINDWMISAHEKHWRGGVDYAIANNRVQRFKA